MGKAKRIRMSNARRLVDDVIRVANGMPLASLVRELELQGLCELRRKVRPRISWNVLMMKAYGIVSAQMPELRRSYVALPRPHFYEHHKTVCMLTMSREYQGEQRLFFARFGQPEEHSLVQLQERFDFLRKAPIEQIPQFKAQLRFAAAPWPIRRSIWWGMSHLWPAKRASHMGTFGMSLSGHKDSYGTQLLSPCTTSIGVDARPRKGISKLLLTFDHRVLDGVPATIVNEKLYFQLTRPITRELKDMLDANSIEERQSEADSSDIIPFAPQGRIGASRDQLQSHPSNGEQRQKKCA